MTTTTRPNVYDIVTDRILEKLAAGTAPWRRPYVTGQGTWLPRNMASKTQYRGINVFLLMANGYASPYWLTFNQAKDLGGSVRKGERGTPVVFWKKLEPKEDPNKQAGEMSSKDLKDHFMLRYYTVFNLEQIDGVPQPPDLTTPSRPLDPIAACQEIVDGMPKRPAISHHAKIPHYVPMTDSIDMPPTDCYVSDAEYYATLFHELAHSTGHSSRLDRGLDTAPTQFGSGTYSKEELIAEMTAAYLCAVGHIDTATIDNTAAYLNSWIHALKGDSKLVVQAAATAQKAADFILGTTPA